MVTVSFVLLNFGLILAGINGMLVTLLDDMILELFVDILTVEFYVDMY